MHGASEPGETEQRPTGRSFCLTELSTISLIGCALAASLLLWLAILAVL